MKAKTILKEALETYAELNPILTSVTGTGRYSVSGQKSLLDNVNEFNDRLVLERTRTKPWENATEFAIPIKVNGGYEDGGYLVYLLTLIKVTAARTNNSNYADDSIFNKNGVAPLGAVIIRKEDEIYEFLQVDFRSSMGDTNLLEILDNMGGDFTAESVMEVARKRSYGSYYWSSVYMDYNEETFTRDLDEPVWTSVGSAGALGRVLYNDLIVFQRDPREIGAGVVKHPYPREYDNLWELERHNIAVRRARRVAKPKKGTVQARINEYSGYLTEFNPDSAALLENHVVVEVLSSDTEIAVLRFISKTASLDSWTPNGEMNEVFRVFVEKKRLTFAERIHDKWVSTSRTNISAFGSYEVAPIPADKLKGTKLEYLIDTIDSVTGSLKDGKLTGTILLEILGTNLFELVNGDENLNAMFKRTLEVPSSGYSYSYNYGVTQNLKYAFGETIDDLINSEKRIKNLSKRKWFKLSPGQLKKVYEFDKWIEENKDDLPFYNDTRSRGWGSLKTLTGLNVLSAFTAVRYRSGDSDEKYRLDNIQHLSEKDFDLLIELLKGYIKLTANPESSDIRSMFHNLKTIQRKFEVLNLVEIHPDALALVKDSIRMVSQVNSYMPNNRRIPEIRSGLNTIEDIREWHDDLVETVNHLQVERDRWYRLKEQERFEKLQKDFEAQKKSWEKLHYKNDEFVVISPKTPSDLSTEGLLLNHCVKSYVESVAHGITTVLFIRKAEDIDSPFYTMEVNEGQIRQVHGNHNSNVEKGSNLDAFITDYAKKHKLSRDRIDRMLAAPR